MIQFAGRRRRRHTPSTSISSLPPEDPKDVAAAVGLLFLQAWQKGTQLAGTSSFTPHFAFSTAAQTPPLDSPSSPFPVFNVSLPPPLSHVSLHLPSPLSSFSIVSSPLTSPNLPIAKERAGAMRCLQKIVCETNHESTLLGTLGEDLAEVLRLVSHVI